MITTTQLTEAPHFLLSAHHGLLGHYRRQDRKAVPRCLLSLGDLDPFLGVHWHFSPVSFCFVPMCGHRGQNGNALKTKQTLEDLRLLRQP